MENKTQKTEVQQRIEDLVTNGRGYDGRSSQENSEYFRNLETPPYYQELSRDEILYWNLIRKCAAAAA